MNKFLLLWSFFVGSVLALYSYVNIKMLPPMMIGSCIGAQNNPSLEITPETISTPGTVQYGCARVGEFTAAMWQPVLWLGVLCVFVTLLCAYKSKKISHKS